MTTLNTVSWNIGRRDATLKMLNGSGYDAALLQETPCPRIRRHGRLRPRQDGDVNHIDSASHRFHWI